MPQAFEDMFVDFLREMERIGLAPSKKEFKEVLEEYVSLNDVKTYWEGLDSKLLSKKQFYFKKRRGYAYIQVLSNIGSFCDLWLL